MWVLIKICEIIHIPLKQVINLRLLFVFSHLTSVFSLEKFELHQCQRVLDYSAAFSTSIQNKLNSSLCVNVPWNVQNHNSLQTRQRYPLPITLQLDSLLQILVSFLQPLLTSKYPVPHVVLSSRSTLFRVLFSFVVEVQRNLRIYTDSEIVVHHTALIEALRKRFVGVYQRTYGGAKSIGVGEKAFTDEASTRANV